MYKNLFSILFILVFSTQTGAAEYRTPLEQSGWTTLTTHEQMMGYLQALVGSSENVKMSSIGTSVTGQQIPALYFSQDATFASRRDEKPLVLIICQQHGDEPSGKEAAMIVARSLLNENAGLLQNLDLILVPQVNPDGSDAGTRRNANDVDLNRNYVILTEPESNAVHQLFLEWMPEVTLDVHEYNAVKEDWVKAGYLKDAEEMLGGVTNLNIDADIIDFTREVFIPETGQGIEADGFRFHRYIVGSPFEDKVVRYSTTAINDARQSMGMYNTLSFIIEGKRYGNLTNEIQRRTEGQVSAMVNFLKTTEKHARDMLSIVSKARSNIAKNGQSFIQMDYFPNPDTPTLHFPVFDLNSWTHTHRHLEFFKPLVKVEKSVGRPAAYCFAASETRLAELLQRHRIPLKVLRKDQPLATETYLVKHITDASDEEKHTYRLDVEKTVQNETLQAGAIIVPVDGAAANLVPLLLEPESTWGIVSTRATGKHRFSDFLMEGKPYPVKRLMTIEPLDLESLDTRAN